MKKNKKLSENYLEKIPVAKNGLRWETDADGKVTLCIDNAGFFNRLAQRFFKKPKVSYVHLDENGSFVWPLIDGKRTVMDIAQLVDAHFGEKAKPLYERLVKFFQILESYNFAKLN